MLGTIAPTWLVKIMFMFSLYLAHVLGKCYLIVLFFMCNWGTEDRILSIYFGEKNGLTRQLLLSCACDAPLASWLLGSGITSVLHHVLLKLVTRKHKPASYVGVGRQWSPTLRGWCSELHNEPVLMWRYYWEVWTKSPTSLCSELTTEQRNGTTRVQPGELRRLLGSFTEKQGRGSLQENGHHKGSWFTETLPTLGNNLCKRKPWIFL